MQAIKLIGKNIGVIILSILVLIIGAIAESVVQECFSGQYLRLVIPAFVRMIILGYFEPPVRVFGATVPEKGSHEFRCSRATFVPCL